MRTDPFREMDRLLDTVLRQVPTAHPMPMDLYRDGESFVAKIDLPGVKPESLDIDVEERTLTIRAERAADTAQGAQWLTRERPTGTFARQLALGRGVDLDHIDAAYADGVLTLTMPVAEEARPRKIEVAHGPAAGQQAIEGAASGAGQG
ncbi:Hsp20/alpha crystallin family protein [Georgenia sp. AZ-5]|uniref:Hsp20/alpha crystallin family protein n=1 Tax=Georgenia sp. AZ-5 TaxID=3367526 RepID=UPI003754B368